MHVPPTSIFFAELQPAASHTETTTRQEHEMRTFQSSRLGATKPLQLRRVF